MSLENTHNLFRQYYFYKKFFIAYYLSNALSYFLYMQNINKLNKGNFKNLNLISVVII